MSDCLVEALSLYGLENAKTTLLRHNENRTYRIDCDGRTYCLRMKNPIGGFDLSVLGGEPESLLRGELELIQALGEQADIPVQQPVKTLSGDWVARLADGTLASLLSWMDGIAFNAAKCTEQMLISAGQTLARLRNAAASNPIVFPRYTYDRQLVARLAVKAEQGTGNLPAAAINKILKALKAVAEVMREMDDSEAILIAHADPGLGNIIWSNGKAGLIDWSLSGYAHSAMDIGGLMGATPDRAEQRLLLQGWESIRGKTNRRHIDAYFALSVMLFVCCQQSRAQEWADWFPAALDRWQATIFDPFASGFPIPCIL